MYIALVPYESSVVSSQELLRVASALQIQVARDFAPIWGESAVVSPFLALEDVPADHFPIAIVKDELPLHHHGFHFALDGLPFALVKNGPNWSVAASHEMLELIADSWGGRTTAAGSLADAKHAADPTAEVVVGETTYEPQGEVEYLVEVCDPCEDSTYEINRVAVSDFVTPDYYRESAGNGTRYSFLGTIGKPLQLLEGGSLSWRARLLTNSIFQASAERAGGNGANGAGQGAAAPKPGPVLSKDVTITRPGDVPSRLSRETIHPGARPPRAAVMPAPTAKQPDMDFGSAFRARVAELLKWLNAQQPASGPPSVQDVINLLTDLEKGVELDEEKLKEYNIVGVAIPANRTKANYQRIIEALERHKKLSGLFGPDMFDPSLALWMCMLTN